MSQTNYNVDMPKKPDEWVEYTSNSKTFYFFHTKEALTKKLLEILDDKNLKQPVNIYHIHKQNLYESIQKIKGNPADPEKKDPIDPGFDFQKNGWLFNRTDKALFVVYNAQTWG